LGGKYFEQVFGGVPNLYISSSDFTKQELSVRVRDLKDRTRVGKKTSIIEDIRKADKIISKIGDFLNKLRE
jgi:hypothetical protein